MTHAPTPPPRSPRGVAPAFTGNVPPLPYREPLAQETFQVANIDDITKFGLTEQQLSLNALQQSNFLFHQLNLISTQLAQLAAETTALRARAAHPSAELRAEIEKLESKARFYESQEELIQNQLMGIKQVIASATSNPQGTVLLNKPKYHQAKTNFTSHHRLQLSYQLGDVITVLDQFPTGWWKGELHGTKGFFQVANTTPLSDINLDEIELNPFPVATPISPRPTHTEPAGGIPPIPSRPVPQPVSDPEIPLAPVREAPPPPAPVARYEPKPTPAAHHEPVKITPVQVPVLAVPQPTANANPVSPRTNPVSPRSNPLSPRAQTPTRPLPNPVPNRALPATPPHSNPAVNNQPPPEPPAKPLPTPPTSKPLYDVSSPQPSKLYDSPAAPVSTPVPPQKPSNLYDYSAPSQPTKPAAASSLYSYSTPEPAPAPVPPAKPADIVPAPTPPPKQQEPAPAPVPPVKPAEVVNAPAPTPPPKQQEVVTPVVHHEPQARPVSVYQNLPVAKVLYSFPKSKQNELAVTKGEIVYVVKDTGVWTLVRNEAGDRGYVPSNYLQK